METDTKRRHRVTIGVNAPKYENQNAITLGFGIRVLTILGIAHLLDRLRAAPGMTGWKRQHDYAERRVVIAR
jgi:hypothetical protein